MSFFRGMRVFRPASGGKAGRGDQPYDDWNPSAELAAMPPRPKSTHIGMIKSSSGPTKSKREQKRTAKALKNIEPLTPNSSPFASEAGFSQSDASIAYERAHAAEGRLAKGKYPPASNGADMDSDTVGAYVNTGESEHGSAGSEWVAKHGSKARRDLYG